MIKKTLAAAIVAGALVFTGASAANATTYPPSIAVTADDITIAAGETTTVRATFVGIEDGVTVNFTTSVPATSTLASIVKAAPAGTPKQIAGGKAAAAFTATAPGSYDVTASVEGAAPKTVTIVVAAAGAPAAGPKTLESTGGEISAAALWVGAGALGLGGLAVVAATARRRAQQR